MTQADDRRRRKSAQDALRRLSSGQPLMRRDIFALEETGQHLSESWERRFLTYLEEKGIIFRPGAGMGRAVKYQLVANPHKDASTTLNLLLTNEKSFGLLLFTSTDPRRAIEQEASYEPEVFEEAPETEPAFEESDRDPEPVQEAPSGDLLELIAERLVLTLQAMVIMKETQERLETKLDQIMKELGVSSSKEVPK